MEQLDETPKRQSDFQQEEIGFQATGPKGARNMQDANGQRGSADDEKTGGRRLT